MDLESILRTIQPFVVVFAALFTAFLTATWIAAVIWAFRDIRARSRDIFAQVLATLMVFVFFPLFPIPGVLLYLILRPRETLAEVYERSLEEEVLLQGVEERLACPGCNRRIETDFLICPTCHTRLKKGCAECGRLLHLRWSICPYCGAAQTAAKPAAVTSGIDLAVAGSPELRPVQPAASQAVAASATGMAVDAPPKRRRAPTSANPTPAASPSGMAVDPPPERRPAPDTVHFQPQADAEAPPAQVE
jgi:RNA polymerase subunit RPABC4/transcription elongation factor Spt4